MVKTDFKNDQEELEFYSSDITFLCLTLSIILRDAQGGDMFADFDFIL
jgi:hypothetical protein